jgi:hypothetical protein
MKPNYQDKQLKSPMQTTGLIFARFYDGVYTNIPHVVMHHSPCGYEWGYGGSGPADLALNICENVLRHMGVSGPKVKCLSSQCYQLAWAMHQDFKFAWVGSIPRTGAVISYLAVYEWINHKVRIAQPSGQLFLFDPGPLEPK